MADSLDDLIASATAALNLPVQAEWIPAVKSNLEVTLKHAALVESFPLPDAAEPAPVYKA